MSLHEQLTADMKTAMKARDKERLGTIRMLISVLKNKQIENRRDLTEAEELQFLATEAKKRRESITAYKDGGREDLAAKEESELAVIQTYLPEQLTAEEVRKLVAEAIAELGAAGKKDMGKVMKAIMPKTKGRFPGKDVKPIVDELLS